MLRVYQIQTEAQDHLSNEPHKGEWVVQNKNEHGFWINCSQGYKFEDTAKEMMLILQSQE